MISATIIGEFDNQLSGRILLPSHADFDQVRKVYNGMIDRKPALIAQCRCTRDVAAAVRLARTHDIPVSIRGGGHNFAGKSILENGLMIDLSLMKEIAVDTEGRTARAETGLKLGEFDRETQKHGLMTPLGVATTTGISGLTLGGGYGWTVGEFGLSCDNVIGLEVVTADGNVVECNAEQNQELFWGMRGAGQNFGIATHIEYRLHELTKVYGGPLFYPLSAEILRFYDEFVASAPDELTTLGAATKMADGTLAFGVVVCYHGTPAEAERAIKALRDFGKPMADMLSERPYLEMQALFDRDIPPGKRYYNKSHNLSRIGSGSIEAVLHFTATMLPYPSMIGFQRLHGAAARVAPGATAFPHRYDHHVVWISPVAEDPALDESMIRWTQDCWEGLRPHADQAVYVNALDDGSVEGEARVRQAYGANFTRLQALKQAVDPTNFFRQNSNIPPMPTPKSQRSHGTA
ncbi:MAG: FAD-binding oxidoreductase [Proteobacteria bacterium]|nr:FAD-binding oxidoreductase [Pseudomonadota bacterium]